MKREEQRKREKQRLQEEKLKLRETKKKLKEEQELRRREREQKKKQEEEKIQGVMIEETMLIKVDELEKPLIEEECELMQDQQLS